MVDAKSCGSPGSGTPTKEISLRRGEEHTAKNVLGSVGVVPLANQSERDVSPVNAICIRSATFSSCELVAASWIFRTRSGCSSAAIRSSSSSEEGGLNSKFAQYLMKMGKEEGQQSSLFLTGVPYVHGSHKSRRHGDPNTMCLHLLHTCTSVTHFEVLVHCSSKVCRYQSNTSRRISSVRISTIALWWLPVIKV